MLCALIAAALACAALANSTERITLLERRVVVIEQRPEASAYRLAVTLAYFDDTWEPGSIVQALREGARILMQCGVAIDKAELVRLEAPAPYRDFRTPESRVLAGTLRLPVPAIFFVGGTRQSPAFEAEAIGRANSGTRPELADTIWVTHGTRDLGIVLAHELVHVMMDSGEHSSDPGNLMGEDTAPSSTRLDAAQCSRLRTTGMANGLLRPAAPSSR